MSDKRYVITTGGCWSGKTRYGFMVGDKRYFAQKEFHSELHAKREAVEHLAAEGIVITTDAIDVEYDGCL